MTSRGAQDRGDRGNRGDREKWDELYASGKRGDKPPSSWVVATVAALPNELPVADIAGGTGRHAVPVARLGRRVVLVDIVLQAVQSARAAEPAIAGVVSEVSALPLRPAAFGVVMVTNFLDRSIFPVLIELIAPGGFLVYETYTTTHLELVERGLARGPQTLDYLLKPGELPGLAQPLQVVDYWEGEVEDAAGRRCCARLLGRKTGSRPEARSQ